jgi:hypothetical protein
MYDYLEKEIYPLVNSILYMPCIFWLILDISFSNLLTLSGSIAVVNSTSPVCRLRKHMNELGGKFCMTVFAILECR